MSGAFFAIAISFFWMDRVAFTPSSDTDSTYAIMGDEDIRLQIANLVAGADAAELGMSPADLRDKIEGYTLIPDMSMEIRRFVADAHARVIGDLGDPVVINADEQVQLVRSERVALQPDITLPVDRVGFIAVFASVTMWTWLISFALAATALLFGLILRPERGEYSFALSTGAALTGVLVVLFGYVVPAFALSGSTDAVWVGVLPRLATHHRTVTLVAGAVFVGIGAIVMLATNSARQRRQRSTPLAVGRFREQQRWSG